MTDTTYTTITVRQDENAYTTMTYDETAKCKQSGNTYVYSANHPIYKINQEVACEIQMYSHKTQQPNNCKVKYVKISQTIVIALHHTNEWLYSTHEPQTIHLDCKNNSQYKEQINITGILRLKSACKAQINDVIIYAVELMDEGVIETYLPEYNVTFSMFE